MPGLTIHYVVALQSAKKNNIKNMQEYVDGSFYPDFYQKQQSHYTDITKTKNRIDELIYKVDLLPIPQNHNIITDHEKGLFLHLLTDYLFYHELCVKKYKKDNNFMQCLNALGQEYTRMNKALFDIYNFGNDYIKDEYMQFFNIPQDNPQYFTKEELKNFIDHCANLNLEEEYENIKKGILPTYDL